MYANNLFIHDALQYSNYAPNLYFGVRWLSFAIMGLNKFLYQPWAIGLITLFIMALAMYCIYEALQLKRTLTMVLVTGTIITAPTFISIHAYLSSAHGYALACLGACFSVYAMCRVKTRWRAFALAVLGIVVSLSTYQAYISFAATLMILVLLGRLIIENRPAKKVFFDGLWFVLMLLVGVVLYYLLVSVLARMGGHHRIHA